MNYPTVRWTAAPLKCMSIVVLVLGVCWNFRAFVVCVEFFLNPNCLWLRVFLTRLIVDGFSGRVCGHGWRESVQFDLGLSLIFGVWGDADVAKGPRPYKGGML